MASVVVSATTSRNTLLCGVKQSLIVMLEIDTIETAEPRAHRPPFELCVVMDRSGSMAGDSIEQAKLAICGVIDALEETDTFHLVSYDDHPKVEFQNGNLANREDLHRQVMSIECDGMTDISAGIRTAVDVIQSSISASCPGNEDLRPKRIFLFSDGQPNCGITTAEGLGALAAHYRADNGIVTCAYGIGSGYDEDVMKAIAQGGGGRYSVVHRHGIEKAAQQALTDLLAVAGTDARLWVRGLNGVVVTEVLGRPGVDLVAGLDLKDLHHANRRKFLIQMDAAPSTVPGDMMDILEYRLQYTPLWNGEEATRPSPIVITGTVSIAVTLDPTVAFEENPRIKVAMALHETADVVDQVAEDLGHRDVTQAMSRLRRCIALLETQHDADEEGMVAVTLGRAQRMLKRLEEGNANMDLEFEVKKARHYGQIQRTQSFCELQRSYSCETFRNDITDELDDDACDYVSHGMRPRQRSPYPLTPLSPYPRSPMANGFHQSNFDAPLQYGYDGPTAIGIPIASELAPIPEFQVADNSAPATAPSQPSAPSKGGFLSRLRSFFICGSSSSSSNK